jgi:copper chaperone CopZ
MEAKTFTVPAINCGHWIRRVQDEISAVQGVRSVVADRETQQVTV